MLDAPDAHAIAVLLLTLFALILFAQERFRIETSSLFVFVLLVVGFQVFPYTGERGTVGIRELFSGFGNEALIAVCALMILGKGLETTGALQPFARLLAQLWQHAPAVSLLIMMLIAAVLSAFINNTPIVVMLLPLLVGAALANKQSPSRALMPFGLATVIGGSMTTIGTSTNLLVVSVAQDLGVRQLQMFDFFAPMALIGLGGIIFLWIAGPLILPARQAPISDQSMRLYKAVLHVGEKSPIIGKSLADVRAMTQGELHLLEVQRSKAILVRLPTLTFVRDDRLHIMETPQRLKELERTLGVSLHTVEENEEDEADDTTAPPESDEAEKQRLVEIVITPQSALNNSTIKRERFADTYGLYVLAVHRGTLQHEVKRDDVADVELTSGDVLLAQGTTGDIAKLKSAQTGLLVLDSVVDLPNTDKAWLSLAIMALVVIVAATGLLPISVSALAGIAAMLVTRCIDWQEAVRGLSIQVVMIIVTSLALGTAMITTGGADFIASSFVRLTSGLSPHAILSGLILTMALLTNVLSNNAAGIIGTPIAVNIAQQLGLDPIPFVVAVIAGVNLSFATPIAYQTNLLVMHAGGYTFADFTRIGLPLTLLMWLGYTFMIPYFFPV